MVGVAVVIGVVGGIATGQDDGTIGRVYVQFFAWDGGVKKMR